ncbi:MAG: hypothetical protein [Microviridae sp.]|nr:MAG: hypothetical protein [Microviridae sp.]
MPTPSSGSSRASCPASPSRATGPTTPISRGPSETPNHLPHAKRPHRRRRNRRGVRGTRPEPGRIPDSATIRPGLRHQRPRCPLRTHREAPSSGTGGSQRLRRLQRRPRPTHRPGHHSRRQNQIHGAPAQTAGTLPEPTGQPLGLRQRPRKRRGKRQTGAPGQSPKPQRQRAGTAGPTDTPYRGCHLAHNIKIDMC